MITAHTFETHIDREVLFLVEEVYRRLYSSRRMIGCFDEGSVQNLAVLSYYEEGTMHEHLFSKFPVSRPRRLRMNPLVRRLVKETRLSLDDLIQPLFVVPGENVENEIRSMPGRFQFSVDRILQESQRLIDLGIKAVILFGIPEVKDDTASGAFAENGIIQRCVREIKARFGGELLVVTDVCLCEYKSDGHCGIVRDGKIQNDETLDVLVKVALSQAKAGADIIAPSDMMDGRVAAIRRVLDENTLEDIPIMSYAAKYSSAFYGPFRDAAQSAPSFGDRKSHQLDYANSNEALKEMAIDISEGADIVMIKPALGYLDVVARAKASFDVPIAAYSVSGEYAMVKAAGMNGWIDEKKAVIEILTSIKRAGADLIISYHAKDAAALMAGR